MQIDSLIGKQKFLGGERLALEIYGHLRCGLNLLEHYALLKYLILPVSQQIRKEVKEARFSVWELDAAIGLVRNKIPREWPPPRRKGGMAITQAP